MPSTTLPGGTGEQSMPTPDIKAVAPPSRVFHHAMGKKNEWIYSYFSSRGDGKEDNPQKPSGYKLHIFLNPADFKETKLALVETLIDAVEKRNIHAFKCLKEEVLHSTPNENRLKQMPYTIYLPNLYEDAHDIKAITERNLRYVVSLCEKIENILKPYDAGDEKRLNICDLPLSKHIRFRLGGLRQGDYVAVKDATPEQLNALKTQGERSRRYKFLLEALNPIQKRI